MGGNVALRGPKKTLYVGPTSLRAYLDVNEDIDRAEAAALLGVGETRASAILSDLYNKHGLIKPVGAARGRGVRYTLSK